MKFSDTLIGWYNVNKRNLPWRDTRDAYLIWLSEIILQQTRVEQGMPYYFRFAERFPTVKEFAEASEDEVLRLWQGLGYYSRGRNMLKTAIKVMEEHDGVFPSDYNSLIKLTGIGAYTAAAISSFSANEARAVVDGNVYRLISRHFGVETPINTPKGNKEFQELANELLNPYLAGEHNQAMIEFGALQCKPKNPNCSICPFITSCYAYQNKKVNELPVKLKTLKIKQRFFAYFVVRSGNHILFKRRDNSDIWAGLHDFPMIEFNQEPTLAELKLHPDYQSWFPKDAKIEAVSFPVKHILTHQRIFSTFIEIDSVNDEIVKEKGWLWLNLNDLDQHAQPKLIFAFLKKYLN
ncbi:A/G-specific adenine glycosylase [Pedobacter glucosidilyticus]|uniref:A/G-specific adenine glycosylase n=1 Tax=Pedobacter glucosidilyticus TaxID=1122941 RepID=UPI0026F0883B|nr:A/G-specific adenine glycosylase [Pedobacter glucosidilyticus]